MGDDIKKLSDLMDQYYAKSLEASGIDALKSSQATYQADTIPPFPTIPWPQESLISNDDNKDTNKVGSEPLYICPARSSGECDGSWCAKGGSFNHGIPHEHDDLCDIQGCPGSKPSGKCIKYEPPIIEEEVVRNEL